MFSGIEAAISRGLDPLRELVPSWHDLVRRYVEAQELQAEALQTIAKAQERRSHK